MTRVGGLEGGLKGSLIGDLKGGLWDGLINDLMKPDSVVRILLIKADFNAYKWFERWFKR